jgi:hypothetical protein
MKETLLPPAWMSHRVLGVAALFLALLGVIYLIYGSHAKFTQSGDYRMHWTEERYVFRGKNPADIFARTEAEAHHQPIPQNGRPNTIDPDLGPADGAYPLWSYFSATLVTWPPVYNSGRFYNGVLNLLVLAGIVYWAYRVGAERDRILGYFLAASVFAVNSICTTFMVGQYGVQVLAALTGLLVLDRRNRWLAAGLCFGFAMIKLSIAAPFALPFMAKGRWRLLFVAGGYLLIGTLIIWPLVKIGPIEVLSQMTVAAGHYENAGYSLNNLLEGFGLESQLAMKLAAVVSLVAAMVILYLWRSASLLTLFGIAAVTSRGWCYHRLYDNLVLVFLLLALGMTAWRTRSLSAFLVYFLVGVSLWMPGRLTMQTSWIIFQWTVWMIGLVGLLYWERNARKDDPSGEGHLV